jgi:Transposase
MPRQERTSGQATASLLARVPPTTLPPAQAQINTPSGPLNNGRSRESSGQCLRRVDDAWASSTTASTCRILWDQEAGAKTADVCRKHGVSSATFYKWKAKFGGLDVSDAKRLRSSGFAARICACQATDDSLRVYTLTLV